MKGDDTVETLPVAAKLTMLSERRKRRFCAHGGTMLIDEDTRLVQCGLCERWLDAFTALEVLTREWQRQKQATEFARVEMKSVSGRLVKLRQEERNTKARLRRARNKLEELEQNEKG